MMHGKCNCGKRAESEWLITSKNEAGTMKWCDDCAPKKNRPGITKIYGR